MEYKVKELISIIVPVYNVEKYLDRCVQSILNQTYPYFELILVDDGSPDNCGKMCDEYAKKDDRVIVIHQENKGLSGARNAGLDYVFEKNNSQYITFIDSDDYVHNQYCELLLNAMNEYSADIVISNFKKFNTNYINESKIENDIDMQSFSNIGILNLYIDDYKNQARYVSSCWKLYKKDVLNGICFPNNRLFEDEFTTYKILFNAKKIINIDASLYYYYENDEGITHNLDNNKRFDDYDARYEQINFFKVNNLLDLYKKASLQFLKYCQWGLINCRNHIDTVDKKKLALFNKQYKNVFQSMQKLGEINFLTHYDYFVLSNPRLVFYYRIKRKILLFLEHFNRKG